MTTTEKKPTFWGVELNEEETKSHRLSYATMSKTFDAVLCNSVVDVDPDIFNNIESGSFTHYYINGVEVDQEEIEEEIFQYFIVSDSALWILKKAGELVFYSEKLNCYIWGVTHWGTSWDYVLTSLKLNDDFTSLEG